jgi:hypothetical protein
MQPITRVHGFLEDFFRRMVGDFFDLYAAFGGHDDHRPAGFAVHDHAQVQLAFDFEAFFDE